jgi:hypothetical protein
LNVAIKKAARRIGALKGTFTRQYDARHSFGAQAYRATGDQATVGRLMLHAEGSPTTARYTKAAHAEVNTAAVAAFAATIASLPAPVLAAPIPAAAGRATGQKLPEKVAKTAKLLLISNLR